MNRLRKPAILAVCSIAVGVLSFVAVPVRLSAQAAAAIASEPAGAAAPAPANGPKVVAVVTVHDFGKVPTGEKVTFDFVLRNDGNAPLQLREVRSDCACAATSFDQSIAPGATGAVHVTLDTTDTDGPLARTITVLTNDHVTPSLALTLKADVQPVIAIRPGYVRYIYVRKEIPGRVVQTLWSGDGQDFNVLEVKSPWPFLATGFHEATLEERRPEVKGKQWIVETILSPDADVGPLADWVEVTTDHPKQKRVRIAVSGFVRPVIAVTPPTVDLGKRNLQSPRAGSLKVQVFATEEIEVTKVESDIPGLDLKLEPVAAGRIYKVTLTLTPAMAKGDFAGTIRIHTASAKMPLLEVPTRGTVE